jgi:hypothetical protein
MQRRWSSRFAAASVGRTPGRSPGSWPRGRPGPGRRRGERVLARADLAGAGWAAATSDRLLIGDPTLSDDLTLSDPVSEGLAGGRARGRAPLRLDRWWHDVAEATWAPDEGRIVVRWVDQSPDTAIVVGEGATRLPQVVRERVTSTYVLSQRVPVRGSRGVCVAVRRDVRDGSLFPQLVPDDGLGPLRPETLTRVEALTRDLAEQAGLRLPVPGRGPGGEGGPQAC